MKTSYLSQLMNLRAEWKLKGIDIDSASDEQAEKITFLREKTLEQSGLTCNELSLICICREHNILKKVGVYARKLRT